MKKTLKKVITLILVLMMLLDCVPAGAIDEVIDPEAQNQQEEVVTPENEVLLEELGENSDQPAATSDDEEGTANEQKPAEDVESELEQPVEGDELKTEPAETPEEETIDEEKTADEEKPADEEKATDEEKPVDEEKPIDEEKPVDEEKSDTEGEPDETADAPKEKRALMKSGALGGANPNQEFTPEELEAQILAKAENLYGVNANEPYQQITIVDAYPFNADQSLTVPAGEAIRFRVELVNNVPVYWLEGG